MVPAPDEPVPEPVEPVLEPVEPVREPVEPVLVPAKDLIQQLAPVHLVNRSPILREERSALFCQALLILFPSLMAPLPARKLVQR
ncbi:hypothetical protein CYMTET_37848 [Cymbomonas tetramitiformis]|uniref:Uncharacterized protein n=1 Tax=Cymbomonas tetramitiformis TaxID=36881 RepID=A0AAE0CD40_9CHLO|nr:hypothetical protein CYMTET_37848 [Cymbomonas tetramitiformis]